MSHIEKSLYTALKKGFIIDPSVISKPAGFEVVSFLRDEYNPGKIVLPTSLYSALKERKHQDIFSILKRWQWRLPTEDTDKWLQSTNFTEKASSLLQISSPVSEFWRTEIDPGIVDEIADEIREISIKLGTPLVSISKSFKHWLIRRSVSMLEVASEDYREFKRNLRRKYKRSLGTRLTVRGIQAVLASPILISIIVALQPGVLPQQLSSLLTPSASVAATAIYQAIVVDP